MKALRNTRVLKGLNLKDVEQSLGINTSFLSEIERGLRSPSRLSRWRLESYFGEKINFLDVQNLKASPTYSTDFAGCDKKFRSLFRMINGLPQDEKNDFCQTAIRHLGKLLKPQNNSDLTAI